MGPAFSRSNYGGFTIVVRYSSEHKARIRKQIIKKAATLFRKRGTDVSIIDLMSQVGLTHGGFYAHFESRDELVRHAFDAAMMQTVQRWKEAGGTSDVKDRLESIVRQYLSVTHRDHPETGCPLPIFGPDTARQGKASRQIFARKLEEFVAMLESASNTSNCYSACNSDPLSRGIGVQN